MKTWDAGCWCCKLLLSRFHVVLCALFNTTVRIVLLLLLLLLSLWMSMWHKLLESHFYPSKYNDFTCSLTIGVQFYIRNTSWYVQMQMQSSQHIESDEARKNLFTFARSIQFTSNVTHKINENHTQKHKWTVVRLKCNGKQWATTAVAQINSEKRERETVQNYTRKVCN